MDNKKPDEMALSLYNNCLYFCSSKFFAKGCALFIVSLILRLKLKIDDNIYWKLVQEEIHLIN